MKPPKFSKLEKLVSKMGAKKIRWESDASIIKRERAELISELETKGKEIFFNDVVVTEDGLLSYNGEQIIIYIKDNTYVGRRGWQSYLGIGDYLDPVPLRRIHLKDCQKIKEMRAKGRKDRYIASQRKTGWFSIDIYSSKKEVEAELYVCKFCLQELNYNNYRHNYHLQNDIMKAFNIMEFFENYESKFQFIPRYNEYTAPKSTYTDDWHIVSRNYKTERDWNCKKCKVDLSNYKKLLDTHHKNGVKSDNRPSNLEVLCKTCHRKEPLHSHMSDKNDEIIKRLRREQGLPDPD